MNLNNAFLTLIAASLLAFLSFAASSLFAAGQGQQQKSCSDPAGCLPFDRNLVKTELLESPVSVVAAVQEKDPETKPEAPPSDERNMAETETEPLAERPKSISRSLQTDGEEAVAEDFGDLPESKGGPSVGGDPHFKTWSGRYYGYHGECDLVMMENPSFGEGLGLDLHIRTKIEDYYSVISSAALRIGSDVLEIEANQMYFNSKMVTEGQKPTSIAGYPIEYISEPKGNIRTEITIGKNNKSEKLVFRTKKGFMWIDFKTPSKENFERSSGLLGSYGSGLLVARDGFVEYENTSEFAEHWQVKDTDDKLFQDLRAPQYPEKCVMPQTAETKRLRRLQKTISREQAADACAHWPKQGQETCIFDVMMTGDLEMAEEPF